jgi:hypothetical protein
MFCHMKSAAPPVKRTAAGRPRISTLTRTEQLRLAKRAQRARDSEAGQVEVRLKLPKASAERLLIAARQPDFIEALTKVLEATVVEVARYPQLKLLCWNQRARYLAAEDAWSLYERNWRFVEPEHLEPAERALIESLSSRFGRLSHG